MDAPAARLSGRWIVLSATQGAQEAEGRLRNLIEYADAL
jgi:hypothetical protein